MNKAPSIRVVIVDDHEVVRIGLRAVLNLTPGMNVVGQGMRMEDAKNFASGSNPILFSSTSVCLMAVEWTRLVKFL